MFPVYGVEDAPRGGFGGPCRSEFCKRLMDEQDIQDSWLMGLASFLRDQRSLPLEFHRYNPRQQFQELAIMD